MKKEKGRREGRYGERILLNVGKSLRFGNLRSRFDSLLCFSNRVFLGKIFKNSERSLIHDVNMVW